MIKKIFFLTSFSVFFGLTSQAQNWKIGNPSDANYAYLKEYKNLKECVDYEKYPNFRTAVALGANDYVNNSTWKALADANFTELVTGNAMKMASCVSSNGSMNFTTVKNFVNKAYAAGHQIYGHTLAWHAQQPNGWLLSLLKDHPAEPIPDADTPVYQEFHSKDFRTNQSIGWHADFDENGYSVTYDATDGMKVHCTKKCANNYYVQYLAATDIPAEKGKKYKMIMTVKGSIAGSMYARVGDWGGGPSKTFYFSTDWQDIEWEFTNTIANPFLLLQHGFYLGDIYIKSIRFEETVMGKTVNEDRRCLVINTPAKKSSASETQLYLKTGDFQKGNSYTFSALVRAEKAAKVGSQIGGGAADPISKISFNKTWQTVTAAGQLNGDGSTIQLNLAELDEDNIYYFDDISLTINGKERIVNGDFEGTDVSSFLVKINSGRPSAAKITENITYLLLPSPTPLTAEEKHDTLVYAMDKWIKGMMEACDGKVKAWDLVNESLSGGNSDSEGVYALQHYEGYNPNGTWDVGGDAFYWQDFMGDLEYVRQACRLARKYGPSDIKLFINDYNLESDWDDNGKLKSLIKWIERWEADGVTKIDGIGTQMHISCYLNEKTQASKKKHIEQMFKLMAASGKLVRVSELDMGIDDENGKAIPTSQVTEEMHQKMADLYEWILKKYFEIIPPEQQWSICQWCATDSPSNSGWRADTPVGLWTLNTFYRKHTYAGFARGLGAEASAIDGVVIDQQTASKSDIYSINGQLLGNDFNALPAGLYIRDGKKVIKR